MHRLLSYTGSPATPASQETKQSITRQVRCTGKIQFAFRVCPPKHALQDTSLERLRG